VRKCLYFNLFNLKIYSILIIVQRDATQGSLFIILQVLSTCFVCQPHLSSTFLQRGQASLATVEGGSCTKNITVPGAVVTVLCTPNDG